MRIFLHISGTALLLACGASLTAQTAVIDTTMGRLTCRLFPDEAPIMTANFIGLAEGTADWKDAASGDIVHGKPFYDATALSAGSGGIIGGDRLGEGKGSAGDSFPVEHGVGLAFDRPGRLAMTVAKNQTSRSVFSIAITAGDRRASSASIFGQCDDASVAVVKAITHFLLTMDNHPAAPVAINHIAIVRDGQPLPPIAAAVPIASVVPAVTPMPVAAVPSPEPLGPTAVIDTTMGKLTCRLFDKETPIATSNFIALAEGTKDWTNPATREVMKSARFYDGLSFNRVIPDFMIQNQDYPGSAEGNGDIGIHYSLEVVPGLWFDRPGRLAIANAGPDKMDSQFFITEHPVHRLDDKYTIFGQCDQASVKVVEAIARLPRNGRDRPDTRVVIQHITIIRHGDAKASATKPE